MGVFGLVLAGHALGSFSLGARLAAVYTLTGAATAVWRGRRMDRGDLRRSLQRDGVLVAIAATALAVCIKTHAPPLVAAALAVALGTALAAIPGGYRAMVSAVVPPEDVGAGYALDAVCVEACFVFGPAVAAVTAWFAGPAAVFVLMAACALAGSLAASRLPSVRRSTASGASSRAPHRIPVMLAILAGTVAGGVALGVLDATFPPFASTLGTKAAVGGIFITVMALGSGTGGLLFGPRVAAGRDIGRRAAFLLLLFGLVILPMAAANSIWLVAALAFVAGAPFALMTTSASVLIQRSVDEARTTEAFSLLNAGLLAGAAIGSALASSLLGTVGARTTLLVAGVGPAVGGLALLIITARTSRRVGVSGMQRLHWSQSVSDQ
jgi:MFS family permease